MNKDKIIETEDRYYPSVYQKFPIVITHGDGIYVFDNDNKKYIDCMSAYGVAILGHSNKNIIDALVQQSQKIISCHGSLYSDIRSEALESFINICPKSLNKVFLSNSGAESIEAALKLAIKHTGRNQIISMKGSYHGKTLGTLSVTWNPKYRKNYNSLLDTKFVSFNNSDELLSTITKETGAIIIEPIQGENGVYQAQTEFMKQIREVCYEKNILLIVDEVQTGLGRTGKMWAHQHYDIEPDILCSGKGLASGLPVGATVASEEIFNSFQKGDHTTTYGANPFVCASIKSTIDYLVQNNIPQRNNELGSILLSELSVLRSKYDIIREIRGLGLMTGVEFRFDIKNLLNQLLQNGLLTLYSGRNILRLLPPFIITEEQIHDVVMIIENTINQINKNTGSN
ncbi:MAG: aspartate aminotransferase family protein [Thermoproteota archaeon]